MVYVHVPFCKSFCTYCDFYSEIACRGREDKAFDRYTDSICREIEARHEEIEAACTPDTLYIGGGTPSVLPLSCLERIIRTLGDRGEEEFTIEVNPEDIVEKGGEYVRSLVGLGVNRVSMGVQSLDDGVLRWMNRRHDAAHAEEAFHILRNAGVTDISVDIIFGISHMDDSILESTLDGIISWHPDHISAYQLSIEEGSALQKMVDDGRYAEAPDTFCRRQYGLICSRLAMAGMRHYEISNWALPGKEAVHNSAYWSRKPYVGLGPGAHSFTGKIRSWNSQDLESWTAEQEVLDCRDTRTEIIMLGLRTADGIEAGICDAATVERLISEGALTKNGERIRIPESHFFVSDDIIRSLV